MSNLRRITISLSITILSSLPAFAAPKPDAAWLDDLRADLSAQTPPAAADPFIKETAAFYDKLQKQPLQISSPQPTATPPAGETVALSNTSLIADRAMRYLGLPYRWGGESRNGLDCSGLVKVALAELSVQVPHSAALQAKLGVPVAKENLRPGDLIFFHSPKRDRISHVGIYLGNEKYIHAARGPGKVTISSINGSLFKTRFAWARRIARTIKPTTMVS